MSKIFEAYDNFIKSGGIPELTRKGKYSLIGMTDEGTKIEIFITKSGVIKTAYPLL